MGRFTRRNVTDAMGGVKVDSIDRLRERLKRFAEERDWKQFHSPKNLAMALSGEIGELAHHFQWLTEEQSSSLPADKQALVAEELADVLLYLVMLSDALGVDLLAAAHAKIERNSERYPVDKAKGSPAKYSDL